MMKLFALLFLSSIALADNYTYIQGPTLIESLSSNATAGGTTSLITSDNTYQVLTGSTTQNLLLPSGATIKNGRRFVVTNRSTGLVTVKTFTTSTLAILPSGMTMEFVLISSGDVWDYATVPSLNGLTSMTQVFATGTSGSDFNISSSSSTHTFNIPDAGASARGLVTTGTQSFAGNKSFTGTLSVTGASTHTGAASFGSTLSVTGASTLSGAVSASSTLNVSGSTTLGSTLAVTGASTLTGAVSASSTLSVTGASTLSGALTLGTPLTISNGGTGQTTKTAAFDALSPLSTKGDLITYNGTNNIRFPACSNGNLLSFDSSQTSGLTCASPGGTGTVTSVNVTVPAVFLTVSGVPITTTGTAAIVLASQSVGTYFGGHHNGSSATPTFNTFFPPTYQEFLSGSGTYDPTYCFYISSGSATAGATYTNNAATFTIYQTVSSSLTVCGQGTNTPSDSGTLTKTSGTGDATLTFSSYASPLYLEIEAVGPGGGGSGAGTTTSAGAGQDPASDTTFGSSFITAAKGKGGLANGADGGVGGACTLGTGVVGQKITGGKGSGGSGTGSAQVTNMGAAGGASALGGTGGGGAFNSNGLAAPVNTGGGGGGAGSASSSLQTAGTGGGAGATCRVKFQFPAASYAYNVGPAGTGGTAGTSGNPGGDGGSGRIAVWEHFY